MSCANLSPAAPVSHLLSSICNTCGFYPYKWEVKGSNRWIVDVKARSVCVRIAAACCVHRESPSVLLEKGWCVCCRFDVIDGAGVSHCVGTRWKK